MDALPNPFLPELPESSLIENPEGRRIIHLDLDAFYASVETLDNPELKGRPVIVGGPKKRGVVSAASYEARKFGVHSAQPIFTAMRLCPQGIFLPVRMDRYKEISDQVFEIFRRYTPLWEPLSIDEAFLDVTASVHLFGPAEKIAREIKKSVREEIGLTISAGVASSKLVAKIASDLHKPDGLTVVPSGKTGEFLDPLPIEKLWGVGKVTQETFHRLNIRTIKELRVLGRDLLEKHLGQTGRQLYYLARGLDDRPVQPLHDVKSLGREETYFEDIRDKERARKELLLLAQRVGRRLRRKGLAGKTITLKVTYGNFKQITRSLTIPVATDDGREIFQTCLGLMEKTEIGSRPIRLLGISLSQFSFPGSGQLFLFRDRKDPPKIKALNQALDAIQDRFGQEAIRPGTLLDE
jgi:DNA polymerase-4